MKRHVAVDSPRTDLKRWFCFIKEIRQLFGNGTNDLIRAMSRNANNTIEHNEMRTVGWILNNETAAWICKSHFPTLTFHCQFFWFVTFDGYEKNIVKHISITCQLMYVPRGNQYVSTRSNISHNPNLVSYNYNGGVFQVNRSIFRLIDNFIYTPSHLKVSSFHCRK